MATNIGNITVTVGQRSNTNIRVSSPTNPTVRSLSYGGQGTLRELTDVDLFGVANNYILVYDANTSHFVVKSQFDFIPNLDSGYF